MRTINLLLNPALIAILSVFLSVIWMLRDQKDKTRLSFTLPPWPL
jgi:hypothetical protein